MEWYCKSCRSELPDTASVGELPLDGYMAMAALALRTAAVTRSRRAAWQKLWVGRIGLLIVQGTLRYSTAAGKAASAILGRCSTLGQARARGHCAMAALGCCVQTWVWGYVGCAGLHGHPGVIRTQDNHQQQPGPLSPTLLPSPALSRAFLCLIADVEVIALGFGGFQCIQRSSVGCLSAARECRAMSQRLCICSADQHSLHRGPAS